MKTEKALSEALDIQEPIKTAEITEIDVPSQVNDVEPTQVSEEPPQINFQHQKEDYDITRESFQELIEHGHKAIGSLAKIAEESESTRAYEALASMIKAVAGASTNLYGHQMRAKALTSRKEAPNQYIDKAVVFTGNPSDLLSQIKSRK